MPLSGYKRPCAPYRGGVRSAAWAAADDVETVAYDRATGSVTALVLREGVAPVRYDYVEDSALWQETLTAYRGTVTVAHELTLSLAAPGAAAGREIEALAACSGVVVLLTLSCGGRVLAGWSPELGTERPLRLTEAAYTSGRRFADLPAEALVLRSEDFTRACRYVGEPF